MTMARILVIDDEPASRELVVTLLGYHGHNILAACDGAQGFSIALAEQPDLIITDILMPELDGYALASRVRADPALARIRIMFYTALDLSVEVRQLAAAAGIAHIVTKPAEPEAILAMVGAALDSAPQAALDVPSSELDHAYLRQLTGTLYSNIEALKAEILARTQAEARLQHELDRRTKIEGEMRRLNADLSRSQAQLASVIESAMDAIITVDDDQRITIWNASAEHMFGCPASAARGQLLDHFIPSRYREIHHEHIRAFRQTGATSRAMGALQPLMGLRADGEEFPIEASISQVAIGGRQLYTVILRDITARVRAETSLRTSEERFAKAFQIGPVAMAICTLVGDRILDVNHSFLRLFGYTRDTLLGQTTTMLGLWVNPDDRARLVELLQQQGAVHDMELAIRTAEGAIRDVLLSADTLQLGGELCVITSLYDISERKHGEQELRATSQQLQDLSRRLVALQEAERRHLARELHDEIGQMLTGLNLLLETGSAFSHMALVARLREALVVVTDITARVRTLSLDLRPSMLDDLGLLPALLWHFERYTAQTQVRVAFKHRGLDQSLDPLLAIAVYRVVQEALTNVARHAHVGEVVVAVWITGRQVVVSIEDQGHGFDLEAALAARRSSGLAGMQERVALLGGRMMIDSAPGQGTRVLAELPLSAPDHVEGGQP
jgi:PAS domain S-box-containing protein